MWFSSCPLCLLVFSSLRHRSFITGNQKWLCCLQVVSKHDLVRAGFSACWGFWHACLRPIVLFFIVAVLLASYHHKLLNCAFRLHQGYLLVCLCLSLLLLSIWVQCSVRWPRIKIKTSLLHSSIAAITVGERFCSVDYSSRWGHWEIQKSCTITNASCKRRCPGRLSHRVKTYFHCICEFSHIRISIHLKVSTPYTVILSQNSFIFISLAAGVIQVHKDVCINSKASKVMDRAR